MKPDNYDDLPAVEKETMAIELAKLPRGEFVIGRCLAIGATILREKGEESDAQDAEVLGHIFFGFDVERHFPKPKS